MGKAARRKKHHREQSVAAQAPGHAPDAWFVQAMPHILDREQLFGSHNQWHAIQRKAKAAAADNPVSCFGTPIGISGVDVYNRRLADVLRHMAPPDRLAPEEFVGREIVLSDRIKEASGRWRIGDYDPSEYVPGDVFILNSLAVSPLVFRILQLWNQQDSQKERELPYMMLQAVAAFLSRQYFIPQVALHDMLESPAPPSQWLEDLFLPARLCTIWFAHEISVPPATARLPPELDRQLADYEANVPAGLYGNSTLERSIHQRGGSVSGVLLMADHDLRLRDELIWMVSANPNPQLVAPMNRDRVRGMVRGWRSSSRMASLIERAVALVGWGEWKAPASRPAIPTEERNWRRYVQTSSFSRQERAGAMANVRVLDVARTSVSSLQSTTGGGHHASPIPHYRHAHDRRVRVGPRDDWHYETRRIEGTAVRPRGAVRAGKVVWRIK